MATKMRQQAALGCRACRRPAGLERAHTIGRDRDERHGRRIVVSPDDIVWLCRACHDAYDAHRLDLYPHLTANELRSAILRARGAGSALRRLSGPLWRAGTSQAIRTIDARLRALEDLTYDTRCQPADPG